MDKLDRQNFWVGVTALLIGAVVLIVCVTIGCNRASDNNRAVWEKCLARNTVIECQASIG
jgi:hypothetical protein